MRRWFPVLGAALPTVLRYNNVTAPEIDHGLNANAHAFLQDWSASAASIVGHFWVLMHLASYAVTAHLADHGIATFLTVSLDSIGDITYATSFLCCLDAFVERFLGGAHQRHHFRGNLPHRECVTHIAIVAVELYHGVYADDIALTQLVA